MEEEMTNHPKWLLDLENRKRKPRLAHEAGAGAPCTNCNSACPGLELHFWRKICKNCKCGRDDHDVDHDEFPQFDLLFGQSGKFKKKSMRLHVNNKKQNNGETTFDWVPPDATKELVVDYMKALPVEKLPIKGSIGAVLRRQLLQKQLPLHDIDYKVCDQLSEQEQKQFEQYLENIKKYVGQGKVIKMLAARPFDCSLITPVNATDMQLICSPQHKSRILSTGVQLRTPSSFATKGPYTRQPYDIQNKQDVAAAINNNEVSNTEEYNCILDNVSASSNIARSQPIEGKLIPENFQSAHDIVSVNEKKGTSERIVNSSILSHFPEQEIVSVCEKHTSENYAPYGEDAFEGRRETLNNAMQCYTRAIASHPDANDETAFIHAESMLADALLPPSAIHANDIIGSTLDAKGLTFIREKLADKYSFAENPAMRVVSKSYRPLDRATDILARENNNSANIGDKYFLTLNSSTQTPDSQNPIDARANPLQVELSSSRLESTFVAHSEQLQNQVFPYIVGAFNEQREKQCTQDCLNDGIENLKIDSTKVHKCEKCHEDISIDDVIVIAEKANNASWHPGCFVCSVCNELLADLVYFYYKNKLYCGRDLATFLGIPRCFACDELIFVREYTVAEGHNYHIKHFCCWDCDIPLAGQQYITENDRPLCLPCYKKSYAKTCAACNVVIAADQQGVAIKNLNFHATQVCFCCYSCKKNLLNGRMAIKKDKLFCSKECIAKFFN
ncbi:testin [Monomorium pharaonis]|uniref:testin n=1 Tax=Monomorium pharaonis TaxID=307658 RepID=UPI00063F44C0|nr:testin [Monomorium pharaonis]